MPWTPICTDLALLSRGKRYQRAGDNVSRHFAEEWKWRRCCRTVTELISLRDPWSGRWHSRTAALTNRVWFVPNTRSPFWWLFYHKEKILYWKIFSSLPSSVCVLYSLFISLILFCFSFMSCTLVSDFLSPIYFICLSSALRGYWYSLALFFPYCVWLPLSFFCCLSSLHCNILTPSSEGTLVIWYAVIVAFFG